MKTLFVLMAQYDAQVVIPLERVCGDYFTHLTTDMFQRKVMAGQIKIAITRMDAKASFEGRRNRDCVQLYCCDDEKRKSAGRQETQRGREHRRE